MKEKSLWEAGRAAGERIWGKSRFERMETSGKEMDPAFWEFALHAWSLFARPELEPKVRSLCLVAALTVMGREDELRMHIFGALNNGATQAEIKESILQTVPYGGLPTARGALLVAQKCFEGYQPPADR